MLQELQDSTDAISRKLDPEAAKNESAERLDYNEAAFRWHLNEDQMATEKLSDGIRVFAQDMVKLENKIKKAL